VEDSLYYGMKTCLTCDRTFDLSNFYSGEKSCKDCKRKKNRGRQLKSLYGITEETYSEMFNSQNGLCFICGTSENNNTRMKFLCVDHCHQTGKVRGLLCQECNFFLGKLERQLPNLERFISYLKK